MERKSLCNFNFPLLHSFIIFTLVILHQKHWTYSASINTTLAEESLFSRRAGVASQSVLKEVPQRKSLPGCGGSFIVQPGDYSFRIYSPDYPLPYPSSMDCVYNVIFPFGLYPCFVDLNFEDFFLDSAPPACYSDRLEIGSQRFCGGKSGSERFETEWAPDGRKRFVLRFYSDSAETGRGFRICITPVSCLGQQPYNPYPTGNSPYYPNPAPVLPSPTIPPQYPYLPSYPTERPSWYPPSNPPYIPADPIPPLYPPPPPTPWVPSLPFCCGTQYQGRHIYLTSPGFPYRFPNEIDCGYLINRISPYVTHIRITFKYFFLPCPYAPLNAQIGVYRRNANGYLTVNDRNFCGCQTGLSVLVPFERYERSKFIRLYIPSYYGLSRSSSASNGKASQLNSINSSAESSNSKKSVSSNFKASPMDIFISNARDSLENRVNGQTEPSPSSNITSPVYFPSADPRQTKDATASPNPRARSVNIPAFRFYRQTNSTRKEDKNFISSSYNRPNGLPAIGFLLAITQVEIPYTPLKRRGKDLMVEDENIGERANLSLPDAQEASSRSFNLPVQSCSINDLPWVRAWLWGLRKKNLLQECPWIPIPPPPPPPPPPPTPPPTSNCGPFYPISIEQNPEFQNQ